MEGHPIENLMKSTLENIKEMVDVNTIVGDPIKCMDGSTIVPVSRVCFGFASGGSEYSQNNKNTEGKYPFGGGSGAGVTVKPVAFLVIKDEGIRLLPVDHETIYDRIVDTVPEVISMLKGICKEKKCEQKSEDMPIEKRSNEKDEEY